MKKGKIAYRFETPFYPGNILYVNLIKNYSCVNNCRFCGRPRNKKEIGKPNIYEKKANSFLYLSKSPSEKLVIEKIKEEIKKNDKEIAFIGLGEPLIYLDKVGRIIKKLKKKYPKIKTRIDTNGATREINENPLKVAKKLKVAGLDEIRISVNAINEKEYNKLCRPKFKDAFNNLTKFVKKCNKNGINTCVSFILNFRQGGIKSRPKKDYVKFALSLGIRKKNIILRNYLNVRQPKNENRNCKRI
ncbi:MAG: radical SAM protein [Nanoarchaeota archaeon]|nr:radical SAM protein [Nanoarchaeota archaeon]